MSDTEFVSKCIDEAMKRFPECDSVFNKAENAYAVWIEMRYRLNQAYENTRNEEMIKRIYQFRRWCLQLPAGETAEDDLRTAITCCFDEHILDTPEAVNDMPRWIGLEEARLMQPVFEYHGGAEGFARVMAAYGVKAPKVKVEDKRKEERKWRGGRHR